MRRALEHFQCQEATAGDVRAFVRSVTRSWDVEGEDAELVASELAANAILHAQTAYSVSINLNDDELTIEVVDQNRQTPRLRWPGKRDVGGRGLHIVEAFSSLWGVQNLPHGKAVWAQLPARTPSRESLTQRAH
jgi:anti-sigma regulatory factor (Ser/Thr protein kinase)